MSYLRYLCLFAHSGVQHILCCVFLRIVYPVLTVSMERDMKNFSFPTETFFTMLNISLCDINI